MLLINSLANRLHEATCRSMVMSIPRRRRLMSQSGYRHDQAVCHVNKRRNPEPRLVCVKFCFGVRVKRPRHRSIVSELMTKKVEDKLWEKIRL